MEEKNNFRSALVLAAEEGETEKVEELYEQFSEPASKKEEFYFALYFAVFNGQEEVVQFFLSKGVDPNLVVGSYLTPLHAAVLKKHENVVKILLDHGADVNPKIKVKSDENSTEETDYFCSPLLAATYKNHENIVDLLLQKGANVNVKLHSKYVTLDNDFEKQLTYGTFSSHQITESSFSYIGYSPLHLALWHDNKSIAKLLLEHGANINARSDLDLTPLCVSCSSNDTSLIEFIVKEGADMKSQVANGKTLLQYLLFNSFENSIGNAYDWYKKEDDIENNKALRTLLKLGADPNEQSTSSNESVLHYAARNGMVNAVHLLLKYGANINALNKKNMTPFQYSVSRLRKILEYIQEEYHYVPKSTTDIGYYVESDCSDSGDEERCMVKMEEQQNPREREIEKNKIYNLLDNKYVYNTREYQRDRLRYKGFSIFNDPGPFRAISQLLARELVKLEADGKKNVEQNMILLMSPFVKPYYIACKNEIEKLKKILIVQGVNHYDFLVSSNLELKEYMKNNITEAFEDGDWKVLFPYYSHFLKTKKKLGLEFNCPNEYYDSNGSSDDEEVNCSVHSSRHLKMSLNQKIVNDDNCFSDS